MSRLDGNDGVSWSASLKSLDVSLEWTDRLSDIVDSSRIGPMRKRGRPPKFDRPSRLVAMTLPEDVIAALRTRDRDLAQAVVAVIGEAEGDGREGRLVRKATATLVQIAPRRFLIAVNPSALKHLPGCELVPIGSGMAFLALGPGRGLADLVLAVMDRLEEPGVEAQERDALLEIRASLRGWMRDKKLAHEIRSIVVVRRALPSALFPPWNWQEPMSSLRTWVESCASQIVHWLPEFARDPAHSAVLCSLPL
jgi:hypothetical protein